MAQNVIPARDFYLYLNFDAIGVAFQVETGANFNSNISGQTDDIGAFSTDEPIATDNGGNTYDLSFSLQEAEAQRIAADMKRLLAMLPYKSLHLFSVKDRFGIYALIDKNENRDKGIHKPRASVRKQLSETKQAASPKKAAARSKQHEMEV